MTEWLYSFDGRWHYANRDDDPEAVESLQQFLNVAAHDDSALIVIEVSPIGLAVAVRCNGSCSRERRLLNDLNAIDSDRFLDIAFCG